MQVQDSLQALLLSFGAGMATMLGALIVIFIKSKSEKIVTVSLGFAAGVMVGVSFTDMLPNATSALSEWAGQRMGVVLSVAALILGVLIATGLDRLVPHEHSCDGEASHGNIYRLGMMSMLAIGVHNFPEGIATFMAGISDVKLGLSIAVAIAMHNIPEGITVAMPIYFATGNRKRALFYTFLSGISEPIGALLAFLLLRPFLNELMLGIVFGMVAGIMLYIAIEELIPSSRQYGYTRLALTATFAGICLMPLTHVI